jgi:hypothetical protein
MIIMKVSLLGPTNMKKFSILIKKDMGEIEKISASIGEILAEKKMDLVVVFNYDGMLKLVGDSYMKKGGKIEMLYTENDYDWETKPYMKNLPLASKKVKTPSWHDMLLKLVSDSDIVICAGLSSGVMAELAYMKWNHQDGKGKVRKLIGIKELLRNDEFPPEITFDIKDITTVVSIKDLPKKLTEFSR